jgi:hypothetical protein
MVISFLGQNTNQSKLAKTILKQQTKELPQKMASLLAKSARKEK